MRIGFYPKLAFDGIRKNRRMYLPYILTCIGMVMMYYIIAFLAHNDTLKLMPGGATMSELVGFGTGIIAVFSCIFLFYSNSFLIRRRKKEFGLYNILGMGKRNIGIILFWEALIVAIISLTAGLAGGIALSKLAELGYINVLKGQINYDLSVSSTAVWMTLKVFGVIFLLLLLNALRQVRFSTALSLMRSENTGEKPPKGNWLLGILGVLILAAAYYIAVTIKDPLSAFTMFFAAVLLVIVGTYFIMISGSVLLCRILQKKKNYYYNKKHFVSVSSMAYRMKRNGAGLASICILATMVLVMISSTAALYIGSESTLHTRYPRDINMEFRFAEPEALADDNIGSIRKQINEIVGEHNITPKNLNDYRFASVSGLLDGTNIETDVSKVNISPDTYSNVFIFYIVPLDDYNHWAETNETLAPGEAMLYTYRTEYNKDTIAFNNGASFKIKKQVDKFFGSGESAMNVISTIAIIVPDFHSAIAGINELKDFKGNNMLQLRWTYNFDTGTSAEQQLALTDELRSAFQNVSTERAKFFSAYIESLEEEKADYYGLFGGLFYLGIILSIVFIFATVLIIYYKQVSEGYEDQSRFEIMQKVGMTKNEIRKSINSQLLTVFFLPLIGAGCHLAFAFPIIKKLLALFNLNNVTLFVVTTAISFLAFALLYTVVYRITSNAYYKIVSKAKND